MILKKFINHKKINKKNILKHSVTILMLQDHKGISPYNRGM